MVNFNDLIDDKDNYLKTILELQKSVLDQQTLLIPDSIGNNRLDTLTNIIATKQVDLLFFVYALPQGNDALQTLVY